MTPPAPPPSRHDVVATELEASLADSTLERDWPVGPQTTYRVGGRARLFVVVESAVDLAAVASITSKHDLPIAVLGRGSNLLVADSGFDGLVVQLGEAFSQVEDLGDDRVRLGGACSLPVVARQLTAQGLAGFEWAVGVPGSVGGAVRMNAGGHGSDMAASVERVRLIRMPTGEVLDLDVAALDFGYRTSSVGDGDVVVWADLQLRPGDPEAGQELVAEIVRWRREHQPGGQNAGSVFTNPEGDSAGRLIDSAGLKGLRIGSAEVSSKHANFIQVDPDGRASDVVALMREIVSRVEAAAGVRLVPETRFLGFDEDPLAMPPDERSTS